MNEKYTRTTPAPTFIFLQIMITKKEMEMPGIEPGASHMRSVRSTTELHPHAGNIRFKDKYVRFSLILIRLYTLCIQKKHIG